METYLICIFCSAIDLLNIWFCCLHVKRVCSTRFIYLLKCVLIKWGCWESLYTGKFSGCWESLYTLFLNFINHFLWHFVALTIFVSEYEIVTHATITPGTGIAYASKNYAGTILAMPFSGSYVFVLTCIFLSKNLPV